MIEITKTWKFSKMESKYLKKLTPKQIEQYNENLDLFESNSENSHYLLNTHALKGEWKGYESFTCLSNSWRDDRIIFKILKWDNSNYYSVELVEFQLIWDHDIYR